MCGIAGILRLDGAVGRREDITSMIDSLAHRGPDASGIWFEGPVALGHRRLSILDPSPRANQPMRSSNDRYVLTYNGEIYNFPEIQRQLINSGFSFRTESDTEVLLEAISAWGVGEAIRRLNGMFAFAVWDRREERLTLGRDRYGIKPLMLLRTPNYVAFASETRAFWQLRDFFPELDPLGLAEYMTFQNIFTDRTFTKSVTQFPAASWAEIQPESASQQLRVHRYWNFAFSSSRNVDSRVNDSEFAEGVLEHLKNAVERTMRSDVEIGAYLSGGLDSGGVVALAAQHLPTLKTFTCGFDLTDVQGIDPALDERGQAENIARHIGVANINDLISARDLERAAPQVIGLLDEPRVGQSYPNYYAAKLASRYVKVVLSGTGGDELFGGYPWRYPLEDLSWNEGLKWHFDTWQRLLDYDNLRRVLGPLEMELRQFDAPSIHQELLNRSRSIQNDVGEGSWTAIAMNFEANTFLPGLLDVEDRISMSFGLETRLPLLENNFVDFICGNFDRLRLTEAGADPAGHVGGKRTLRRALAHLLPAEVLSAPKRGFSAPDDAWFRQQSVDFVCKLIHDADPRILNREAAQSLISLHVSGQAPSRLLVWSLLVASTWSTSRPLSVANLAS